MRQGMYQFTMLILSTYLPTCLFNQKFDVRLEFILNEIVKIQLNTLRLQLIKSEFWCYMRSWKVNMQSKRTKRRNEIHIFDT